MLASLFVIIAFDLLPALLIGSIVGLVLGLLAYGADRGIQAFWRWLTRSKR